jgi:porin
MPDNLYDKFGIARSVSPTASSMVYNSSRYHDYATGGVSSNFGFYALADVQVWQANPALRTASGRGLYLGVSAMCATPKTNIFTQYYETRLYALGPLNSRPKDMMSLVYNHQVLSGYFEDTINRTAHSTGTLARDGSNSFTVSYALLLVKGIYLSGGLGYTDHPSATYISREGSALNLPGSLFSAFCSKRKSE